VIHAFRRALLDHVTCAVAGSAMPVSRALLSYFQENDASRVATVIASGAKLSAANAHYLCLNQRSRRYSRQRDWAA